MPLDQQIARSQPTIPSEDGGVTPRRVLVVDADPGVRFMVVEALTMEGWSARGSATAPEALEILESWRPDVILLDVVLPVMPARAFRDALAANDAR